MRKVIELTITIIAIFCVIMFAVGVTELSAYMAGIK